RKSTVSDFNSMQQGSQKQMNQLESGIIAAAKATAIGFGKEMGRMKAYAHAAMNGAIGQLNQGISGIDSVLSQFGGNKAVIKPIKFAHGSNGHLTENQMAMVNDAAAGPRQEAIVRNNNIYLPKGNNRIMPLLKGDQVLNGRQTQQITHYAKGSGVSDSALEKIVDAGQKNPGKSFNQNFNVHIDVKGSQLQKGTTELEKNASQKYGKPWIGAMWKVVGDQMDSAGSGVRSAFLKYAMQHFTGKPYLMGGLGPKYYDCSGMVYSALKHFGINIGRDTVSMQNSSGVQNLGHKRSAVKQGDLIIYGHGGGAAGHVGIIDNPTKGTMFNETPPRARVTSIFPPMSMGYDYFRIKGLKDSDKQSKATSVSSRLYKLAKSELGKSAIGNLQKRFADQSAAGGPVPKGDHMHWLEQAGMPRSWWSYVSAIINRESKWDPKANNPTSSAYGIPQALPGSKMRSAGSDWRTNPITQLRWMKSYIKDRYGSAQNAWRIRQTRGWYANGGWSKDKQLNIFGEVAGQREVAINPKRKSADNLIDQTIEARATADKSSPSADYLNSIKALKVKQSRPKIEPKITLNFNGDISDEKTMNKAVDKFKRGLTDVLTQINDEFGLDDSVW
ncbi:NlpC/P60 family protein, partial [Lentilactobacillus parabuchneri]